MIYIDNYDYFAFSYFDCPLSKLKNAIDDSLSRYGMDNLFNTFSKDFEMCSVFEGEAFHNEDGKRILVIFSPSLKEMSSVLLVNMQDGWNTLVYGLSKDLGCETIRIRMSNDKITYPINLLEIYNHGSLQRFIRVMHDGRKWDFFQKNEPLYFENVNYYKNRKIIDRFNRKIIIEYLQKIGLDIKDNRFWSSNEPALLFVSKKSIR